jgi:hypothetical protein
MCALLLYSPSWARRLYASHAADAVGMEARAQRLSTKTPANNSKKQGLERSAPARRPGAHVSHPECGAAPLVTAACACAATQAWALLGRVRRGTATKCARRIWERYGARGWKGNTPAASSCGRGHGGSWVRSVGRCVRRSGVLFVCVLLRILPASTKLRLLQKQ